MRNSSVPTYDVWRIRDLPPRSSWSAGRAILIGDAAHAATPRTSVVSFAKVHTNKFGLDD